MSEQPLSQLEEIWKPVKGYENLYKVSDHGNVYSYYSNKNMTPSITKSGYYEVKLRNGSTPIRSASIHRLVMEIFFGSSALEVNHKDGNKLNNRIDNLEYLHPRENINHHRSGKYLKGVSKNRDKFKSAIRINGVYNYLGVFDNEIDAHLAYVSAIEKISQDKYCKKHKAKVQD